MGMSGYSRRRRAEDERKYREWYATLTPEEKAQEALRIVANQRRFLLLILAIVVGFALLVYVTPQTP